MGNKTYPNTTLRIPGYQHIRDAQCIAWLEGSGNYTIIYLKDDPRPLMVSQTLKVFELHLPAFIRISKSSLVNPTFIDQVIREDAKTMHLRLADGKSVSVSRRRITETITQLDNHPTLAC